MSLRKNWKAGSNTLIIEIASSGTVEGMEAEAAINPPPPPDSDTISQIVCNGEHVSFGGEDLTKSGYYFHSFQRPGGCDSNVVLHLDVLPKADTVINQSICEGQSYEGHTTSGTVLILQQMDVIAFEL